MLVCGAERCAQLHGAAMREAATILERPLYRRSGTLPFYDVLFVWRDPGGAPKAYDALRWVPRAGATRTSGAGGPLWSHTDVALTAALSAATDGLRPRPAGALNDPMGAEGLATTAARRALAPPSVAPAASTRNGPWPEAIAAIAAAALAALGATAARWRGRRAAPGR